MHHKRATALSQAGQKMHESKSDYDTALIEAKAAVLSAHLEALRSGQRLTKYQIAKDSGINEATVARWIREEGQPALDLGTQITLNRRTFTWRQIVDDEDTILIHTPDEDHPSYDTYRNLYEGQRSWTTHDALLDYISTTDYGKPWPKSRSMISVGPGEHDYRVARGLDEIWHLVTAEDIEATFKADGAVVHGTGVEGP